MPHLRATPAGEGRFAVDSAAAGEETSGDAKAAGRIAAVTEPSAAGSEEMASSSGTLGARAGALKALAARFKTDGTAGNGGSCAVPAQTAAAQWELAGAKEPVPSF